jgi:hypothetical protein
MNNPTLPQKYSEAADGALALTRRLIDKYGPRPAGSKNTQSTAQELLREAEPLADKAWIEDFSVSPGAFLGWIRILVGLYAASTVLLWFELYLVSALLVSLGLAVMVGQFFLYREVIDFLFARRTGHNVLAAIEPQGKPLGQLIVSGHHDSAYIFNFLVHQPALYPVRVIGGIGTQLLLFLVSWILTIWTYVSGGAPDWGTIVAGAFSFLFLLVGQLWWFASPKATPGAGDNLASTAAAWEALKEMAKRKTQGYGLQHLRLVFASWDAEESGLRGARSWVAGKDDGRLDLPTWNLNLECLYDPGDFFFLTSDINGSVKLSEELAGRCQRLMRENGHDIPAAPISFLTGGTDAGELAKGGVRATTLVGMPWGNTSRSTVYHTPADTADAVSKDAVARAIRLAVDLALDLDQELTRNRPKR